MRALLSVKGVCGENLEHLSAGCDLRLARSSEFSSPQTSLPMSKITAVQTIGPRLRNNMTTLTAFIRVFDSSSDEESPSDNDELPIQSTSAMADIPWSTKLLLLFYDGERVAELLPEGKKVTQWLAEEKRKKGQEEGQLGECSAQLIRMKTKIGAAIAPWIQVPYSPDWLIDFMNRLLLGKADFTPVGQKLLDEVIGPAVKIAADEKTNVAQRAEATFLFVVAFFLRNHKVFRETPGRGAINVAIQTLYQPADDDNHVINCIKMYCREGWLELDDLAKPKLSSDSPPRNSSSFEKWLETLRTGYKRSEFTTLLTTSCSLLHFVACACAKLNIEAANDAVRCVLNCTLKSRSLLKRNEFDSETADAIKQWKKAILMFDIDQGHTLLHMFIKHNAPVSCVRLVLENKPYVDGTALALARRRGDRNLLKAMSGKRETQKTMKRGISVLRYGCKADCSMCREQRHALKRTKSGACCPADGKPEFRMRPKAQSVDSAVAAERFLSLIRTEAQANRHTDKQEAGAHMRALAAVIEQVHSEAEGTGTECIVTGVEKLSRKDCENDFAKWNALHVATASNDTDTMQLLLERINVCSQDESGMTALHIAVLAGHEDAVRMLLDLPEAGECATLRDKDGNQPIHLAALVGLPNMIELLLGIAEETQPVTTSKSSFYIPKDTARYQAADVNARNHDQATPLMLAACAGSMKTVTTLVQNGADAMLKDQHGRTAIHYAAYHGELEALCHLLSNVAVQHHVDQADVCGYTPLAMAVRMGHDRSVHELMRQGADEEWKDNNDNHLLNYSIVSDSLGIFNSLLAMKRTKIETALSAQNNLGYTPLMIALIYGRELMVAEILTFCEKESKTPRFWETKIFDTILGETGINLRPDSHSRSASSATASSGDVVKSTGSRLEITSSGTISNGIELDNNTRFINISNNRDVTALMLAAYIGSPKCVIELCRHGANYELVSNNGDRALHFACFGSGDDGTILELLELSKNEDIDLQDNEGRTPLHLACMREHKQAIRLLKQRGADPTIIDKYQLRPQSYVRSRSLYEEIRPQIRMNPKKRWIEKLDCCGLCLEKEARKPSVKSSRYRKTSNPPREEVIIT